MRFSVAVLLLCSLLVAAFAYGDHDVTDFCDPANYTESLNLNFANQFSFVIEAALKHRGETVVVREYFDEVGNRGRFEYAGNGSSGVAIFDYDDEELFFIPDIRGDADIAECTVFPLATSGNRFINVTFGVREVNGTAHIGTVQQFILLGNGTNATYLGVEEVRGIPCDRYQTCTVRENTSYTLDYYFSTRNLTPAYESQSTSEDFSIPVQIVLQGLDIIDGSLVVVNHTYTIVAFNSGPDAVPDEVFTVPAGLACKDRLPGPPPPSLPQQFSTYIEAVEGSVFTFREFYDFELSLFRFDVYYNGSYGGPPGFISIIDDFELELQYIISRHYRNCTIIPLMNNNSYIAGAAGDDGLPRIRTPRELFLLNDNFNYSYQGVVNVRGLDVDSWISIRDFENLPPGLTNLTDAVYEIFFTRPGQEVRSVFSNSSDPIPWRLKIRGTVNYFNDSGAVVSEDFSGSYDLFDFSTQEPNYDIFDISDCYSPQDYVILTMAVPYSGMIDFGAFRQSIRTGIVDVTQVYPLQVGRIEIIGANNTHVIVTLHISNLTMTARVDNRITGNDALQMILDLTSENGQLPFQVELSPDMRVFPFLFQVSRECPECDECHCDDDNVGAAVGITIAFLVIGLLLGVGGTLLTLFIIKRCRSARYIVKTEAVSYEKQEDEVVVN